MDCNKNFVFYWINKNIFPNAKQIYVSSHPCDYTSFSGFTINRIDYPNQCYRDINTIIYLDDYYSEFKNHSWMGWYKNVENIILLPKLNILTELNSYEEEKIII